MPVVYKMIEIDDYEIEIEPGDIDADQIDLLFERDDIMEFVGNTYRITELFTTEDIMLAFAEKVAEGLIRWELDDFPDDLKVWMKEQIAKVAVPEPMSKAQILDAAAEIIKDTDVYATESDISMLTDFFEKIHKSTFRYAASLTWIYNEDNGLPIQAAIGESIKKFFEEADLPEVMKKKLDAFDHWVSVVQTFVKGGE